MFGARQSASTVHVALQEAMPLHLYGAQASVAAAWQLPTPSQVRACVSVDVFPGHEGATQTVPAA